MDLVRSVLVHSTLVRSVLFYVIQWRSELSPGTCNIYLFNYICQGSKFTL